MQNNLQTYQKINTISAIQKLSDIKDIYSYPPPVNFYSQRQTRFFRVLSIPYYKSHSSQKGFNVFTCSTPLIPRGNGAFYVAKHIIPAQKYTILYIQIQCSHSGTVSLTPTNAPSPHGNTLFNAIKRPSHANYKITNISKTMNYD